MKKTYKLMSILLVVAIVMSVLSTTIFAMTPGSVTATSTAADETIKKLSGKIFSAIRTAGVVLSVIMLSVLGIKYMMGSSEEKAEYKKSMMPYLVGAVLIFGASTIAGIVYDISSNLGA